MILPRVSPIHFYCGREDARLWGYAFCKDAALFEPELNIICAGGKNAALYWELVLGQAMYSNEIDHPRELSMERIAERDRMFLAAYNAAQPLPNLPLFLSNVRGRNDFYAVAGATRTLLDRYTLFIRDGAAQLSLLSGVSLNKERKRIEVGQTGAADIQALYDRLSEAVTELKTNFKNKC